MKKLVLSLGLLALVASAARADEPGVSPGPGTRYATDAYPGFDTERAQVSPTKKTPKWFAWINGPNRDTAREQFAYCRSLEAAGDWSKAVKHYDALVRQWPTEPEAPKAQQAMADILFTQLKDYEEAFEAYRYLLDFFSLRCDYNAVADRLYEIAGLLRLEGKTILFFRFKNTVDVRRAFETCVLRAPGAKWAPEAMLTIGDLREEEGKFGEAVKVYENLRNIHFGTAEALTSLVREGAARMQILKDHAYNRERVRDTIDFLKLAMTNCRKDDVARLQAWFDEACGHSEEEAFRAAEFYDSRMRTRRSALSAYERFVRDYPESVHVERAKARIVELKGETK